MNVPPSAYSCNLYPCVNTYGVNVSKGLIQERLLASEEMGIRVYEQEWSSYWMYMLGTKQTLRNGVWQNCTKGTAYSMATPVLISSENIDQVPSSESANDVGLLYGNHTAFWYPQDCVYTFGFYTLMGIESYLATLFRNQTLYAPELRAQSGTLPIKNLWHNGTYNITTVNDYFRGLTDAMTATIRMRGDNGSAEWAKGTVMVYETCVQVRWAWLSFPAVLIALELFFLVILILETSWRQKQPLWKSASVALVYAHVDAKAGEINAPKWTRAEIQEKANRTKVRLCLTRDAGGAGENATTQ